MTALHVTVPLDSEPQAHRLLSVARSRSALARGLLRREYGGLVEAWGELRAIYGSDEALSVLSACLLPELQTLRALGGPPDAASRIVAGCESLGLTDTPEELTAILEEEVRSE